MTKITLHSGITITGKILDRTESTIKGAFDVRTETQKVEKFYKDKSFEDTGDRMMSGTPKIRHRSDKAFYQNTEKALVATVYPSTIKEMIQL